MNSNKPVQLAQKIDYLHDKINATHQQVIKAGLFQMKMKFIQFIDTTIEKIYNLDNKNPPEGPIIQKKYQQQYKSQYNEREQSRIQREKNLLAQRIKEVSEKEKNVYIQGLKIQIENAQIIKEKIQKNNEQKQRELKEYIFDMERKLKSLEKQLQKVIKMNGGQAKEIELIKEQRNKAEKKEIQWMEKYQTEIQIIEKFSTNREKYAFRHSDGLRINRTFCNTTTSSKGGERLVMCDLPLKFQVLRISFGIKVGVVSNQREIQYMNQISLYEKEDMILSLLQGLLVLQYIKRKVFLKLQKYKVVNNQVMIMLFGKGDSISLDETQ